MYHGTAERLPPSSMIETAARLRMAVWPRMYLARSVLKAPPRVVKHTPRTTASTAAAATGAGSSSGRSILLTNPRMIFCRIDLYSACLHRGCVSTAHARSTSEGARFWYAPPT